MKFSCLGNIEYAINNLRNRRRILRKNVSCQTIFSYCAITKTVYLISQKLDWMNYWHIYIFI